MSLYSELSASTIPAGGQLTRPASFADNSGFIAENANHWSIESYLPVGIPAWQRYLCSRSELDSPGEIDLTDDFVDACGRIQAEGQAEISANLGRFARHYYHVDPDRDTVDLVCESVQTRNRQSASESVAGDGKQSTVAQEELAAANVSSADMAVDVDETLELCEAMLKRAAYTPLDHDQIQQCAGVASQWGVPLHVNFELFERLVVYARGDIIGTRVKRRWRKLYRREAVEVPIYQRMVVMFQLREQDRSMEQLDDGSLHLRMFKNIPKQDIDMLLPGTKVRISGVDRVKIILPSLGGLLMSARKIAQYALLFTVLALHWTAILLALVVGYLFKSFLSYFQTKNRYQLNLTRNLYFQKLDANAGVGFHVISQAANQSQAEMMLAYFATLTYRERISTRRLRRRCERIVRESAGLEVNFRVEQAIDRLVGIRLLRSVEGGWAVQD